MSKRKSGARQKRTRSTDIPYPDAEEIASRLRIAPPPSVTLNLAGRFAREEWNRKGADFDLHLATDDSTAPSPLSHLLGACLRLRGLCDLEDPRREAALRERAATLVLLDEAAKRYSPEFLQARAMFVACEIERGMRDWPATPHAFVEALCGETALRACDNGEEEERRLECLQALERLGALDSDRRRPASEIAKKIELGLAPASLKRPLSALVREGCVGAKVGRGGGCWLEQAGLAKLRESRGA